MLARSRSAECAAITALASAISRPWRRRLDRSAATRQRTSTPSMSRPVAEVSAGTVAPSRPARFSSARLVWPAGASSRSIEPGTVGRIDQGGDVGADQVASVTADQVRQSAVDVQQHAALGHRRGALAHLLHDDPVGPVGAGQGVQPLLVRAADHDRVDAAAADRGERRQQILELAAYRVSSATDAAGVGGRELMAYRPTPRRAGGRLVTTDRPRGPGRP